jgi:serine protease Do
MEEMHPGPNIIEPNIPQRVTQPLGTSRRNWGAWIALGIVVGALIIAIGVVQAAYHRWKAGSELLPAAHPVVNGAGPSPSQLSNSFRAVAKAVEPAVVNIKISETVQQGGGIFGIPGFPFGGGGGGGGRSRRAAEGSGVIVTPDGYVLTNNHVVENADKIDVTLADGRRFKGTRVGTDPETDLALVKIDASALPTAVLGNSDELEQGDWVLAIGSPFGLQQTLTAGIVSATGRIVGASQFDRYIQTDASINPGNSGGPLVNMQGEVVGINTLIFSQTGSNVGIGFAIPSNLVRQVYGDLAKHGKVTRAYLGVFIKNLDPATASGLRVDAKAGVLVERLSDSNGPAAKAGIQSGDVITAVDGKHVQTASELTDTVASKPVGSNARIDFIRDGKQESATVTLAERPTGGIARGSAPDEGDEGGGGSDTQTSSKLGLTVQTVTPDTARRLGLKSNAGAVVVSVQPGGAASEASIRPGDVIHRIHQSVVRSADDFAQAAKSLSSGEEVLLQIERQGQMAFVTVTIE